jgi:hypothetical protein
VKKFASYFLALDRKFKITQNDIIKILINCQKSVGSFWAVDRKFKITQNDINETFDQLKRSSEIRSTDKKKKVLIKRLI